MTKPLLGIAATLAATLGAPWLAAAQTPRDALVQAPAFAKPERGSLTGALANLSFGAADVSRGAYSLPLPLALPSERGGVLASVVPTYSPDAGISEWGVGWSVGLSIQRYRVLGDVDYATDDFTSPWGRLVAGNDGYYYPSGLASPIRLKQLADGWEAIGPDGTRYEFAQLVDTTDGTYAWYLTSATTIFGDGTSIEYETNAGGRPFVKHVFYGGREDSTAYRADFEYTPLPTALHDFRSGADLVLDRRVSAVVANVKHRERGTYQERWRYAITYADSPFGPGFYLDMLTRTFASGESEPPLSYDYDLGEVQSERGLEFRTSALEPAPVIEAYLSAVGDLDGLQSDRAAVLDLEEDGVSELEYVYDYSLASYSPSQGWTLTPLPPPAGEVDGLCRPGDSMNNGPRTLVRLQGSGGPVSVLAVDAFWDTTEVVVCDRAGVRQHSAFVEGSWVLGANTKIVDLNRDDKPDLLRLDIDGYHILENVSDRAMVRFATRPGGVLEYEHGLPFEPDATWAHDLNGDGNPDLLGRTANRVSVWYGRGRFRFDEHEHAYPFVNLDGSELFDLAAWEIAWVDANNDGLTDALLSVHNEAHLFVNEGTHFAEVRAAAFDDAWDLGWLVGSPVVGDHHGRGETEVAYSGVDGSYSLSLTRPSLGLLTRADDGRGNVVDFGYGRMDPHPVLRHRSVVLRSMTSTTGGYDAVTSEYRYSEPVLHSIGGFLVGYGRTEQVGAVTAQTATFYNDDDIAGAVKASLVIDGRTPHVVSASATVLGEATYAGVRLRRATKELRGWCAAEESERCLSGEPAGVFDQTEFLEYRNAVCPVHVVAVSPHGVLTHVSQPGNPAALAEALHCTTSGETWTGLHADAALDFSMTTSTARNEYGQATLIQQVGQEVLTLQESGYDPVTHRLAWLRHPGTGTQKFTFDPATGALSGAEGADGVITSVQARDPVTDAIGELFSDRGPGGVITSSYRFDGEERLAATWSDFGGSSRSQPLETIAYQYPTLQHPGHLRTKTLVDARNGTYADSVAWVYPDGNALATAAKDPTGWTISAVSMRNRSDLRSRSYWRAPLPAASEPELQTYESLEQDTTLLSETRAAGFGHQLATWTLVQSGVARESAQDVRISGSELVTTTTENASTATRIAADAGGRVSWTEDEDGVATQFRYDALGRLVGVVRADGGLQALSFDTLGRPSVIDRPGLGRVVYEYGVSGMLTAKKYYDAKGVLERTAAPVYDSIGRIVGDDHTLAATGAVRRYRYRFDGAVSDAEVIPGQRGYLTTVESDDYTSVVVRNPDGTDALTSLTLDAWMQVETANAYLAGGAIAETRRTITRLSDRAVIDDVTLGYRYDAYGRLQYVTLQGKVLAEIAYDHEGRLDRVTFAGGGTIDYSFDPTTHRATGYHRTVGDGAAWESSVHWARNDRGLVDYEVIGVDGRSWRRDYSYDARKFLVGSEDDEHVAAYTYDAAGLPVTAFDELGERTVARDGFGKLDVGGIVYGFDSLGRVTSRGDASFSYGPDGHLATARIGDRVVTYAYDEAGNRILKREGGRPAAAYVAGGYLAEHGFVAPLRIGGQLIGVIDGGRFEMLATDVRGTVIASGDGTPRLSSPYGARTVRPDRSAAFDFVEKGYDSDLGAVRMGVRDYDPLLGQFWTPDLVFLENIDRCAKSPVECNLYGYALNNPISFVDATGTDARRKELDARFRRLSQDTEMLALRGAEVYDHLRAKTDDAEMLAHWYTKDYNNLKKEWERFNADEQIYKDDLAIDHISRVPMATLQALGLSAVLAAGGTVVAGKVSATTVTGALWRGGLWEVGEEVWGAVGSQVEAIPEYLGEAFEGIVYRSGADSPENLTPKIGKDDMPGPNGELTGISTYKTLEAAVQPGRNAIRIDTTKLVCLLAVCDNPATGHVSITTGSVAGDQEWSAEGITHWATRELLNAVLPGKVKRPK